MMTENNLNKFRIALFLYFLTLYVITIQGIQSADNLLHYHRAQNILKKHSLSMPEGKYNLDKHKWLRNWTKEGKDERIYLVLPDGLSIASLPFTALGNLIELSGDFEAYREKIATAQKNNNPKKEGYYLNKLPTVFSSVLLNAVILTLLAILFFNFTYSLTNSIKKAFISTILLGNATILWVYSTNYWTQPLTTFCMFSAFYALYRFKKEQNFIFLLLAGLAAGYSYITRYASIISLPFFILYLAEINRTKKVKPIKNLAIFSIPLFIFLFTQLYWNFYRFGSFLDFGVFRLIFKFKFFSPYFSRFIFSLSRSIFIFSPPLILALFGIKKLFQEYKYETITTLGISLVFLVFYSLFGFGMSLFGSSWGPRYLVPVTPFLLLPVCMFINEAKWNKLLTSIIFVTGFSIQLIAVLQPLKDKKIREYFYTSWKPSIYYPLLKSEIIPQAKSLFTSGPDLWMLEGISELIAGLILMGICLYSLGYCFYQLKLRRN